MWRRSETRMQHTVAAFSDFLISDDYYEYLSKLSTWEKPPRCLLDVVEIWLGSGNATEVCPSFEVFLLTVIDIIEHWSQDGDGKVLDYPLIPERLAQEDEFRELAPAHPVPIYEEEVEMPGDLALASNHPVLRREHFELHQARGQRQRDDAIRRLLTQQPSS